MNKKVSAYHLSARRLLVLGILPIFFSACNKIGDYFPGNHHHGQHELGSLKQFNLVANNEKYHANRVDPNLLNAWGLSFGDNGAAWISAQGAGVSTIYDREGRELLAAVNILTPGLATGVVNNTSDKDFLLSNGKAAKFIFVGVDGLITGWNSGSGGITTLIKNNISRAVYTGVALANDKGQNFLYAANALSETIDVFDHEFKIDTTKLFKDPKLPAGYLPFNIHLLGDKLFVTYTKVASNGLALKEVGNGVVNIFSTSGVLLARFADGGKLNAPWGVAVAPASFFPGKDAQDVLLIGNFRDGKINAYAPDGTFIGQLKVNNKVAVIDGLWEITFPPVTTDIDRNRLYFTAGPNNEKDGLFGYLSK